MSLAEDAGSAQGKVVSDDEELLGKEATDRHAENLLHRKMVQIGVPTQHELLEG